MNEDKKTNTITQINMDLLSIGECAEVARGYINKEYEINDIGELVAALASVSEEIEEIQKLIYELMEDNYE